MYKNTDVIIDIFVAKKYIFLTKQLSLDVFLNLYEMKKKEWKNTSKFEDLLLIGSNNMWVEVEIKIFKNKLYFRVDLFLQKSCNDSTNISCKIHIQFSLY